LISKINKNVSNNVLANGTETFQTKSNIYLCFVMNDNCNTLSTLRPKRIFNPFTPTVAIWVQLRAERQSARMSKNYKWRLDPVCQHRMLYSCTHTMATVGVKGLIV